VSVGSLLHADDLEPPAGRVAPDLAIDQDVENEGIPSGSDAFEERVQALLDQRLTEAVTGIDQTGASVEIRVPVERALTLYLNAQEIVTMMTINDYPEYLALGYLLNQNMLKPTDVVTEVEYDDDLQVVVVRTEHGTNFEQKLKKKTLTSGCAQGTAFGDLMESIEDIELPQTPLRTSWIYQMTHEINTKPSLYLTAGAIHGCVLCEKGEPICYMEDVGRHNALDKLAGAMARQGLTAKEGVILMTSRLSVELVQKAAAMGAGVLAAVSAPTALALRTAEAAGLCLVGVVRSDGLEVFTGFDHITAGADVYAS
jgi:FdhD protein